MTAVEPMLRTWNTHLEAEFTLRDVDATMATMTDDPQVIHLGTMTGGSGRAAVREFYRRDFLPGHPPDTRTTLIDRVIGETTIIDQLIYECTHTIEMPWLLPGVPPTGRRIRMPTVVFVTFKGDRIDRERIYFDMGSLLAQIGLLDPATLPIVATESARLLAGESVAPNQLIERNRGS